METLAKKLGELLEQRGYKLVTAESCTGGGLAQVVTAIAGSSRWFERGFVTYSNASKQELLGVKSETLARHGAVSPEIAQEMAEGALRHSHAQLAVAITGIAGPEGGTPLKPVGTVWLAWAEHGQATRTVLKQFTGDRKAIRCEAVRAVLEGLLEGLS
jgi:nicotinamide-nucleotide amidase